MLLPSKPSLLNLATASFGFVEYETLYRYFVEDNDLSGAKPGSVLTLPTKYLLLARKDGDRYILNVSKTDRAQYDSF
jgi:hypothetical protein